MKLKGFLVEVTFDSDYRKIIDPDFGPSHYLLHNVHDWSLLFDTEIVTKSPSLRSRFEITELGII